MKGKSAYLILILILISVINIYQIGFAADINIVVNGEKLGSEVRPVIIDDNIFVQARAFADELDIKLNWIQSIKTLTLEKYDKTIKMMLDSSYIQVDSDAIQVKAGMTMIEGHTYIPVREVVENFGYLTSYEKESNTLYIYKAEAFVQEVAWQETGEKLVIKMNKITPYRINNSSDPRKLIIGIDRAILDQDFIDNVTNSNFYLEVNKISGTARLELILKGKYPIPFINESGIEENDGNIIISFAPGLKSINWNQGKLDITASGKLNKPEIMVLNDPKRMVLDFPELMLSDFDLDLKENEYIKDVRVSQFKYEPLVLRVVIELKDGKYLQSINNEEGKVFTLRPAERTTIRDLSFSGNTINFKTTGPIEPDLFTLNNPERLVINIINAVRADDLSARIDVDQGAVKSIRTARFNEETVRIVVDLKEKTGYNWKQSKGEDGLYHHKIILASDFCSVNLIDLTDSTDINIELSKSVDYDVKKFSYPDRLVVDIAGINIDFDTVDLPKATGLVSEIRGSQYMNQGVEYNRIVFDLNQFNSYKVLSEKPGEIITITLQKQKTSESVKEEPGNMIYIDPGHGGFDPGAIGNSGLEEKAVNLAIARQVFEILQRNGYNAKMTREEDVFISLKERVQMANQAGARIFVSIHSNSSSKKLSEGTEVYLAPNKNGESLQLARRIYKKLLADLQLFDRGVRKENFYVIKYTDMPAALVEVAFLSNPHEESLLQSDLFREKAAKAIAAAISEFLEIAGE